MKSIIYLLSIILVTYCAISNAYTQTDKFFYWVPGSTMWYLEYLPPTYSPTATGSAKSPVIIFLHGAGENGSGQQSDLTKLKGAGGSIPYYINKSQWNVSLPFIVLSPQTWGWWDEPKVTPLAQQISTLYPGADTSRIYLTGLSQGGAGVWDSIRNSKAKTDLYAAAVPICGAQNFQPSTDWQAPVSSGIPIWAFHNNGDPTVGLGNSQNWVNGLNSHNICPASQLTIFTSNSHDAWTAVYGPSSTIGIYQWFLQFTNQRPLSSCLPSTTTTTTSATTVAAATTVSSTTSTTGPSTTATSTTSTTGPATTTSTTGPAATTVSSTTSTTSTTAPSTTTTTTTTTTGGTPSYGTWLQKFKTNYAYWEYKPSFTPSGGLYPLIVNLHGSDAMSNGSITSTELNKLLVSGIPKFINDQLWNPSYPFIVVSPQSDLNANYYWNNADSILSDILTTYNGIIDPTRIYITGQGRGAVGITLLSATNINKLAAAHFIRIFNDYVVANGDNFKAASVPTWFYTNQDDPYVPVSYTNSWVNGLTATPGISPVVRTTINPTGNYNSPNTAQDPANPSATNLYNWFLTYTN